MGYLYVSYVEGDSTRQGTCADATGVFAALQTGSFVGLGMSNVYPSLLVASAQASEDDTIFMSNVCDEDLGNNLTISFPTNITVLSALSTACEQYSKGAKLISSAVANNTYDIKLYGYNLVIAGLDIITGDYLYCNSGYKTVYEDCDITFMRTTSVCRITIYDSAMYFYNCNITTQHSSPTEAFFHGRGELLCDGCVISSGQLLTECSGLMGTNFTFNNCDFSACNSTYLTKVDKEITTTSFTKCTLPPNLTSLTYGTITTSSQSRLNITACTDPNFSGVSNPDSYYYQHGFSYKGEAHTDTTIYLSATYDKAKTSGFSISLEGINNSISNPLRHKLLELAEQDLTTDKTYKVNFQSDTQQTDTTFWLEVVRPDATSQALGVVESNRGTGILVGTPHTANAEPWNTILFNRMEDEITILGMAGVDNASVEIWLNLADNTNPVYCDPEIIIS